MTQKGAVELPSSAWAVTGNATPNTPAVPTMAVVLERRSQNSRRVVEISLNDKAEEILASDREEQHKWKIFIILEEGKEEDRFEIKPEAFS